MKFLKREVRSAVDDPDQQLLIDIDLGILGPITFAARYESQPRCNLAAAIVKLRRARTEEDH